MNKTFVIFALCLLSIFAVGCKPKSEYPVVSFGGTLTYQGKSLGQQAIVTFTPERGRSSSAVTDENGNFKAIYTESLNGVQVGKLQVTIAPYSSQFQFNKGAQNKVDAASEAFQKYAYGSPGFEINIEKANSKYKLDLP